MLGIPADTTSSKVQVFGWDELGTSFTQLHSSDSEQHARVYKDGSITSFISSTIHVCTGKQSRLYTPGAKPCSNCVALSVLVVLKRSKMYGNHLVFAGIQVPERKKEN
jgi:hypothetical protein